MKKELLALAQRNRNKMKYKTMKPPLQKDFITANTIIKDKTIKSNDDNNLNKGSTSPLVNTGKEIVIKNTNVEDKYFNNNNNIYNNSNNTHTKDNKSASSIVLSGSNYNKMVPEVGVVVKQDNQSKNGGLNFQNQFGKMSVKEYEQLRAMYMNGGNSGANHHSSNNYSSNMSSQYNNSNHVIVRDNSSERSVSNVNGNSNTHHYQNSNSYAGKYLYKRSRTDDTMVNSGNIMHYNWNDQPLSYNNNNSNNINSSNTYSTHNGILNEDLFKGRKIHQLKTNNIKRNSVPHNMYNYSLPINLNYYNTNTNNNTNTTSNNIVSTIPLRKQSPSNNRSRRKF